MARVLRSTKITIAEDPSTEDLSQHQEKPRTESRGPLEPLDNVTETVVVSVDEANQADEEKLLKAAFKSAIGVKKKKKNKKDRRTNKTESGEQASGDNSPPDENVGNQIEASENDNDKLQHLLKDLQDTHITEPAAAKDITLIRNVPTEPASHRRTRSQHANARQVQPGQYIPPSHYPYSRGGIPGPQWSHRPGFSHHGLPAPAPLPYSYRPPQFSTTFHGPTFQGQPGVFAGPPRHLFQGYQNGLYDGYNHNEQIRRWISQSTPQSVHAVPVANPYPHEVEQPAQQTQQEPIYVYTGPSRYVSNSTIEISAASGLGSFDGAPSAPAPITEQAQEVEHEGATEIEAQLQAQIQDNEKAIAEVTETLIRMDSDHDMQETEKASVAEVKAPTPATESETEIVRDEPPAYTAEVTHDDEDSFIHHIVERSPAKPARRRSSLEDDLKLRFQSRPTSRAEDMVDEIEKFEDIITRSPAKPISRIEDSVEKLDQEFDMMEALAEAASPGTSPTKGTSSVQAIPDRISSKGKTPVTPAPAKTGTIRRAATVNSRPTPTASSVGVRGGRLITSRMAAEKASTGTATVRAAKAPVPRQSVAPTGLRRSASVASDSLQSRDTPFSSARPLAKRPLSLLPPKITPGRQTARPPTRPTFELPGEKVARELKEKREAREARMAERAAEAERAGPMKRSESVRKMAATPTVRSSKPPTKPSFELPGDALSRKKREEHAAKLKAQEEEERKRREFKARPVRKSVVSGAAVPKETAASLARKSIVSAPSELAVGKRSLRPSIAEIDHDNVVHSAPRTRVSPKTFERKSSVGTKPAGPSMSGLAMQRTPSNVSVTPAAVSAATAAVAGAKKLSGKEVYNRDALASQNLQQEQKAKMEAAKKAREEAAERGRQASKEWAEKQRLKMERKATGGPSGGEEKVFEMEKYEKNRALGIKMREESTGAGCVATPVAAPEQNA